MKKYVLTILMVLSFGTFVSGAGALFFDDIQELSPESTVSLVTAGPGTAAYTIFGHTFIRIQDPLYNLDVMANYGVYNPNQDNFYLKFLDGTAEYSGELQDSRGTIAAYTYYDVDLVQQDLRMTEAQKNKLLGLIQESLLPENKYYRYDFFFDNCSTRVRDLLNEATDGAIIPDGADGQGRTIRWWIDSKSLPGYPYYDYVYDLFLGREVDQVASYTDEMFLPDMLFQGVANGGLVVDGVTYPLVIQTFSLNDIERRAVDASLFQTPAFWWWMIFTLTLVGVFYSIVAQKGRKALLSFLIFYLALLGILGLIFLFAQFFSLHTVTHNNIQIWWMWPTHLLFALGVFIKRLHRIARCYLLLWIVSIVAVAIYMIIVYPVMGAFFPMQLTGLILAIWYLLGGESRRS